MIEKDKGLNVLKTFLWSYAFASYPVVFLWSKNWEDVFAHELCLNLFIVFLMTTIAYVIYFFWTKDSIKTTLLCTLSFFMFFSFGHIFDDTYPTFILLRKKYIFWNYYTFVLMWTLLFLVGVCLIKKMKTTRSIFRIQNIITLTLLVPALSLLLYARVSKQPQKSNLSSAFESKNSLVQKPNIYYLILDEYGRQDVLKEFYNLDISDFTAFLKSKDFFIADKSCSNYSLTFLSIPSSLKMSYLDISPKDATKKPSESSYSPSREIGSSQLFTFLKTQGYIVSNIPNVVTFTTQLQDADYQCFSHFFSYFTLHLIEKSFLVPFYRKFCPDIFMNNMSSIISHQFKLLRESVALPSPHIVFCHLLCPHQPFIFDQNGKMPDQNNSDPKILYKDQIIFLNKILMEHIEEIISKDPHSIILLQGDHGPCYSNEKYYDDGSGTPSAFLIKERMTILNAYRFPEGDRPTLPADITPINSFRIILNHYFKTSLPLLPNTCFWSTGPYYLNLIGKYTPEEINLISMKDQ